MKKIQNITLIIVVLVLFTACNRDNIPQQIHQQISFFIQNEQGDNLLDSNAEMTYFRRISFLDLNDQKADVPINGITYDKNSLGQNYIKYISGAKRILLHRSDSSEIYTSKFFIKYNKYENDTKIMDNDTLDVSYSLSPSIFEVIEIKLNGEIVQIDKKHPVVIIKKN